MSAPPAGGQSNGAPKPNGTNPPGMRPNRPKPKPSIFAPKRTAKSSKPAGTAAKPPPPPPKRQTLEQRRKQNGGWSEPMPPNCQDIPIMTTKKELLKNITYHMMKLASTKTDANHDPTADDEFARPVTLHRRDPLAPPPGRVVKTEEVEKPPVDAVEAERLEKLKEEREAQKVLDQAKIAPVTKEKAKPKKSKKDDKLLQRTIRSPYQLEQQELKYQESRPWFLEDADGKNVWQSSFIKAHSKTHVAFKIDQSVFRMIPIEKWYKFDFKPAGYKTWSTEEAEELMGKKMDVGRWAMKNQGFQAQQADLEATRSYLGAGKRMIKTENSTFRHVNKADKMDNDELDVSGDEFQDDDEAHVFERTNLDEDEKESKDRIRREQMGANLFGQGNELELEKELEREMKEEEQRKTWGKSTKKALVKRDRDHQYESSSGEDRDPWKDSDEEKSASSDSDDEDTEDEEEKKKKEEASNSQSDPKDKESDKNKPGVKGSTPQRNKPTDASKKGKNKVKGIKRTGSPAVSESSGNESTRKTKAPKTSALKGSRAGTPMATGKRKAQGAGSGSDGEATAGEMSDGAGPKKKIKLKGTGGKGTPSGSRAGSPIPPLASPRAGSPLGGGGGIITSAEVLEKIPPEGVPIKVLSKSFASRIGDGPGQMARGDFINIVKQVCTFEKTLLKRKV